MNNDAIIKLCLKHGGLTLEQTVKTGKGRRRCKQCQKAMQKRYYEKNKEIVLAKHKIYRDENPEKRRLSKLASYAKHGHKWRPKINARNRTYRRKNLEQYRRTELERHRKYVETLADGYVKQQLRKKFDIKREEIDQKLISFYRIALQLKRAIRKRGENKNGQQ